MKKRIKEIITDHSDVIKFRKRIADAVLSRLFELNRNHMEARTYFLCGKSLLRNLLSMILLVSFTVSAQIKFDSANPDQSEKTVKKLINAKLDDLKKWNVKKVIIFGCKGEFILSKTTAPSTWEGKDMTFYEKEKETRTSDAEVLDHRYCVDITTRLLDSVKSILNKAGIEVVETEVWQPHPVYQEMLKIMMDYDADQGTKYGLISPTVTTRTLTVPAYGYRIEPENLIKMMKYEKLRTQDKGKILEDHDAQAFCSIGFRIDGLKDKPNLSGLDIIFETGMKKYDMGSKDKDGNKVYMYSLTKSPVLSLKNILEYQSSVLNSDKRINVTLYDKAVLEMQSYVLSLYQDKLKSAVN